MGVGVDWPAGADGEEHIAWIREFWTHIEPFTRGFYSNDGDPEMYTPGTLRANYRLRPARQDQAPV